MAQAYGLNCEYLQDELKRLDLLLRLRLADEPLLSEGKNDRFRGVFMLREEIDALLDNPEPDFTPSQRELWNKLLQTGQEINERAEASYKQGIYLPLTHLTEIFRLSPLGRMCVIICLAPELDRKYEKIYAYLQDDLTCKMPGVELILKLLFKNEEEKLAARLEFSPETPLMRFLINCNENPSGPPTLLARTLKLEERIVNFLTGYDLLDPRLSNLVELVYPGVESEEASLCNETPDRIGKFLKYCWSAEETASDASTEEQAPSEEGPTTEFSRSRPVFYFYGPPGAGKLYQVKATCRKLGIPLLIADLSKSSTLGLPFPEMMRLLVRETLLQNAALCLDNLEAVFVEESAEHITGAGLLDELFYDCAPLVFILGEEPWRTSDYNEKRHLIEVVFTIPEELERRMFWESQGKNYRLAPEVDLDALAGKFRFTPGQISAALRMAGQIADWKTPGKGIIDEVEIYQACYRQSNQKLSILAQKIIGRYGWEALVLPADQMEQLHEICNQVKYKHLVYGEWRFGQKLSLGKGLNVMFSGPPGCGKTMAAEVIAGALHLELYKIDLSRVVSKYIGETEKNLGRIFDEAETSNAILFFDEADALFGKRSEVKDAHDRYANIETGYLLQKMEEYEGLVILASNLCQNMDQAFLRRMQFTVEFPFPEKEEREEIWRKIFPAEAPLAEIDFHFLASKVKLAGGNIKNIALRAAFYAAADTGKIGMKQIMLATRREYHKLGKTFLQTDFEPYHRLIEAS